MVRAEAAGQPTKYRCQCGALLLISAGRGVRLDAVACRGCGRRRSFWLLRAEDKPVAEVTVGAPDAPREVPS